MRLFPFALAAALLTGCGYVASPLAPLARIPARITDLAVVQRGGTLIVQATLPRLTTEGAAIEAPVKLDLRIGPGVQPWDADKWGALASRIPETAASPSGKPLPPGANAHYEIPAAQWIGKDVVAAALVVGANGKIAGWSNFVNFKVIAPPERPTNLSSEVTPAGLRLTWQAHGDHFRVLRATGNFEHYDIVATVIRPEWTDPGIQFGATYRYMVQTFVPQSGNREVQSDFSDPYTITPQPIAPGAPKGLRAVPAPNSIELSWDGNPEPDVTGYRIYRGLPNGALEKIGETGPIPTYSDRTVQHGRNYRYAVTAVGAGQESPRSSPVAIAYP